MSEGNLADLAKCVAGIEKELGIKLRDTDAIKLIIRRRAAAIPTPRAL